MKIESIQALRGIAFLLVFTSHCAIGEGGAIGVSLFLVMSGFLLVQKHCYDEYRITFITCYRSSYNRIKKLYPLHIVTMLMALPFLYNATKNIDGNKILYFGSRLVANIGLIQAWFPQENIRYSLNNLSWYLCVCSWCYFVFPIILKLIKQIKYRKNLIIFMIAIAILQWGVGYAIEIVVYELGGNAQIIKGLTYNSPLFRTIDFIEGCLGSVK